MKLICGLLLAVLLLGCSKNEEEIFNDRVHKFASGYPGMTGYHIDFDIVFTWDINEPSPTDSLEYKDKVLLPIAVKAKQYIIIDGAVPFERYYLFYFICTFSDGKTYIYRFFY